MADQTCKASQESPGYIVVYERGKMILSCYVWDIVAVHAHSKPDHPRGPTAITLRRDEGALWLATFCSVAEVMAAIDDAIAERKKAAPVQISASALRKATGAG